MDTQAPRSLGLEKGLREVNTTLLSWLKALEECSDRKEQRDKALADFRRNLAVYENKKLAG